MIRNQGYFIFLLLVIIPAFLYPEIDPLYYHAAEKLEKKQFDSALVYFNELVEKNPQKKEALYNRGLCYYRAGKFTEAISDFDRCLTIDSVFSEAILMKGLALQKREALPKGFTEFKSLDTTYSGYETMKKRIKRYQVAVLISRNWYYMIAIMFMIIILFAVIAKSNLYRK